MKKNVFLVITLALFTFGCQYFSLQSFNEWEDTNESTEVVVYCAGRYTTASSASSRACYWENTTCHDVKDNLLYDSEIWSIFVYNDDVYTAGFSNSRACWWKNDNEIYYLGNTYSRAWSIYISSGVIYVAGYDYISSTYKVGYWTITPDGNIKQTVLITSADMNSVKNGEIYVDEEFNIYMAGTIGTNTAPTGFYYNSNKGITYYDAGNSEADAIFVKNGIAYIGGAHGNFSANSAYLCYWKETELIYKLDITADYMPAAYGYIFSINVSNHGDIYVGGWSSDGKNYIKNKTSMTATGFGGLSSIVLFNDILYAGTYNSGAGYTKGSIDLANNTYLQVPSGASSATHRSKIFVISRKK